MISRVCEEWPHLACFHDQLNYLLTYLNVYGHWGWEETIVAAMEIFNLSIRVCYECSMVQTFNAPDQSLKMFYRLRTGSQSFYNHYDSVMDIAPLVAATLPSIDNVTNSYDITSDLSSSADLQDTNNIGEHILIIPQCLYMFSMSFYYLRQFNSVFNLKST